jgi:hypothetical protein
MKSDPPLVVPPQPTTSELSDRLGEIIAERPPQPLTWELSGRLGEIIAERIAGLPPEQRIAVAQQTIIEILITRTEVPLTGLLRRHVALELARLWIPERELKEIYGQREVKRIEGALFLAKYGRKNKVWAKAGLPQPQSSALQAVADSLRFEKKHGRWTGRGFHSVAALAQYLKRWRAKKNPQP